MWEIFPAVAIPCYSAELVIYLFVFLFEFKGAALQNLRQGGN